MGSLIGRLAAARDSLLTTSGLGSLTAAAWTAWGTAPGLAATGVALLIVEFLSREEPRR